MREKCPNVFLVRFYYFQSEYGDVYSPNAEKKKQLKNSEIGHFSSSAGKV